MRGIYCIETMWYGDASPPSGSHWGDLPPVGDAPAMAATLRGARPTTEALRARADDFSPERAADAYLELFEKLLTARAP